MNHIVPAGFAARARNLFWGGPERRQFFGHVSATFAVRVVLIATGLITSIMTARILGPAGRGLFSATFVMGAMGGQFANLGMHSANTYYVARDRGLFPQLVSNALCMAYVIGGSLALLLCGLFILRPSWAPVHGELLTIGLILIPVSLSQLLLQNLLLGVKDIRWYNIVDVIFRTSFVIVLGLCWLAVRRLSPEQVALVSLSTTGVAGGVLAFRNVFLAGHLPRPNVALFRKQADFGMRSYLTCLSGYAVLKSDVLLVKYLAGATATGLYSLASSMTDFIYTFPAVVGMILFPMLAGSGDLNCKWRRARKTTLGVSGIMALIAACAALVAKPITAFMFGRAFLPAVPAFLILCVAIVFYGANNVVSIFFSSCGQPWRSVWPWSAAAGLNISLNLVIIPRWGIEGAAFSSLITYVALFLVQYLLATLYVRGNVESSTDPLNA